MAEQFDPDKVIALLRTGLEKAQETPENIERISKGIKKKFDGLAEDYRRSTEFLGHVSTFTTAVNELSTANNKVQKNIYEVLKALMDNLSANQQRSTAPKNVPAVDPAVDGGNNNDQSSPSTSRGSARQRIDTKRMIERSHQKLEEMKKLIKKFGEEELSLDDLDKAETPFTRMEQLEKKYVRTAENVAKIEQQPIQISKPRIVYNKSGFDVIDKAVTKLIRLKPQPNQGLFSTRTFEVPNYADFIQTVRRENEKHSLGLSEDAVTELAKRVGADVIQLLKAKTWENLDEYLNEIAESNQPLPSDPDLEGRLKKNDEIMKEQNEKLKREIEQRKSEEFDEAHADEEPGDECHESDLSEDDSEPKSGDTKNGNASPLVVELDELDEQSNGKDTSEAGTSDSNGGKACSDSIMFAITPAKRKLEEVQESAPKNKKPEVIDLSDDDD